MKTGAAFLVAVFLAAAATFGVYSYVNSVRKTNQQPAAEISVIVSKVDIQGGSALDQLISGGDFTTMKVLTSAVVTGAVTDISQLRGHTTSQFILAGEQIPTARLKGSTVKTGGVLNIPAGDQAITISLEPQRVVDNAIQTGDHVVVYATLPESGTGKNAGSDVTVTLVPDVLVLKGASQNTTPGAVGSTDTGSLMTLALSPSDAQRVVLAQEQGHIWLGLLPPGQAGTSQAPLQIETLLQ